MAAVRPKITDVARLAGVSTATVSRTISNPALVNPDTRRAVEDAIQATGYRLNHAARNLRHQRTGGIVALVPNLANTFFSQILSGIASVLTPAGYNLLITDTRMAGEQNIMGYAEPSRADGLIVLDGAISADLLRGQIPVVQVSEWIPALKAPRIMIDNAAAAGRVIHHLADLGHRRIGHVMGPRGNVLTEQRLAGVRQAMAARDLPLPDTAVLAGDFTLASGRAAAAVWLDIPAAERPTAMFLASDEMACGFMGALLRRGVAVPGEVSVVGFDDIDLLAHVTPALSTIRQPREAMGRLAAQHLLDRIGGGADTATDTVLPVELILRETTALPQATAL